VKGLQPSNSLLLNGVRVGQVKKVEIQHEFGDSVLVELSVNSSVKIGDGTMVVLESAGLLDGMQLRLDLKPNTKLYEGDQFLIPYVDEGLMGKLSENGQMMENVFHQVAMLSDSGSHFRRTLTSVLSNLDTTMIETNSLMSKIDETVGRQQFNIEQIIQNFALISKEMKSLPKTAESTLLSVKVLLDSINATQYPMLISHIDSTMQNVQKLTESMIDSSTTLGALFTQNDLYCNMNKAITDLDFVLVDFQANPSKYINVSVFGKQPENEKPIIKKISPDVIDDEILIKLKREIPASFTLSVYDMENKVITKLDPQSYDFDRGAKTVRLPVPNNLKGGEYVLHATWLGASSGQSISVTLR
jgi:phospholipid/cholesterol/gamma-HCH transport system substrate-binding protein